MKISLKDLRKLVKEAAEVDAKSKLGQHVSAVSKAFNALQADMPEDGLSSDVYIACDEVDAALRKLASLIADNKGSSLSGKGVQHKGHHLGSRWVPED